MEDKEYKPNNIYKEKGKSKKSAGVICALFVPFVIAIMIGCCCFEAGTYERKTFFKGYWTTILIVLAIFLVFGISIAIFF